MQGKVEDNEKEHMIYLGHSITVIDSLINRIVSHYSLTWNNNINIHFLGWDMYTSYPAEWMKAMQHAYV